MLMTVMAKLRARGLQFEQGRYVRDLGLDNMVGRKRRRTTIQKHRVVGSPRDEESQKKGPSHQRTGEKSMQLRKHLGDSP